MEVMLVERGLDRKILVDSAGTHAYHSGEPPDRRAVMSAQQRNVDISGLRARQVSKDDFQNFDLFLCMDSDNVMMLRRRCPRGHQHKIRLLMDFADINVTAVPDPYYGGSQGFEKVLDLVHEACDGLLEKFEQGQIQQQAH